MELMKEFFYFLKDRKKFWLVPLLLILGIFGGLLIFGASGTAIAPFIYSLF